MLQMKKYLPEVLETERLTLRPLTIEDKRAIFKWASDPEVARFMMYSAYKTLDDAEAFVRNLYTKERELQYGFVWKKTRELIGAGGMNYYADEDAWHIGYNLRQDMWGKGITTEACKRIVEYAREKYHVRRIIGNFANKNPASGRVLEKLGMKYVSDYEYTKFDGSATYQGKEYEILFDEL